ncbi:MAG: carboxyl transferase domain-containing protein [Gemmatimonadota bacterium]
MTRGTASGPTGRLGTLANEIKVLRERLRQGGGVDRIDAQHEAGKLTARERVGLLLDPGEPVFELGLLVGYDTVDEGGAAAGVVTSVGRIHGRETVVVANDATVDGGTWSPGTVAKIQRAQEVAMRCRLPVVYLADGEEGRIPVRGDAFPGRYGAGRILYYAALMRRHLGVPQLAAVMGPSSGTAAYLPALSDVIVMVEGTSFLGVGDPRRARAMTGRDASAEELGGARVQTEVSGLAHYRDPSDPACLERLRHLVGELPAPDRASPDRVATPPVRLSYELYDLIPDDHRQPYDVRAVLECLMDGDPLDEFQPEYAPEIVCVTGFLEGVHIGVVANARGLFRTSNPEGRPRLGGVVYAESARKVAYFVETMNRQGTPLLFLQDVAGFMVGEDAEREGTLRAGADFVEVMATATVPKVAVTVNHAVGAGYHAMAGQGFDPDFTISLPTGRLGIAETEDDDGKAGADALQAAARGLVDDVLLPEELRPTLGLVLRAALRNPGPHVGPFQIP